MLIAGMLGSCGRIIWAVAVTFLTVLVTLFWPLRAAARTCSCSSCPLARVSIIGILLLGSQLTIVCNDYICQAVAGREFGPWIRCEHVTARIAALVAHHRIQSCSVGSRGGASWWGALGPGRGALGGRAPERNPRADPGPPGH